MSGRKYLGPAGWHDWAELDGWYEEVEKVHLTPQASRYKPQDAPRKKEPGFLPAMPLELLDNLDPIVVD